MKNIKYNLLLVLAALIWGAAFSAQSIGMDYLGPFTFNGTRFIIGGIVLLPVIGVISRINHKKTAGGSDRTDLSGSQALSPEALSHMPFKSHTEFVRTLLSGIICGCFLALASALQQVGIKYTSPGKAGFITALYIILVPIIALLFGKRSKLLLWISAVLAVIGMYFLCLAEGASLSMGDFLIFLCAIGFAMQITSIDRLGPYVDSIWLSCIEFFTAGIINFVIAVFTEDIALSAMLDCLWPLLYCGVLSSGVAYTLQIIGQKKTAPVLASLLMSLESVFSVLTAWLFLGDTLSGREIIGCIIVFAAIILAQL